jgi:acyl-CoA synthetase (AMP-forming)/AMP-acid ligase II
MDWSFPLLAACERNPRRVALRYRATELTFAELDGRIAALARGLARAGAAGQTVAWMLANTPEAIELSMALARIGAVSVPINWRLELGEIEFILADSGAERLLVDPTLSAAARELAGRANALGPVESLKADGENAAQPASHPPVPDERVATVLYTSGTTGFPKGVMRSHRANAWNVVNSALGSPRFPDDVELFNLPAFGVGLLNFALPALLGGATVVLDHAFAAERVWQLLQDEAATRTFLAPTMVAAMLDIPDHERFDLDALKVIYTAYHFPEPVRARALERFGDRFLYMYGLTEVQLTCAGPGRFAGQPDNVGTGMGAVRVRVVDPSRAPVASGEVGEIALQGPAAMDGYLGRPEETAQALHDGWVLTGDLGWLDDAGELHYVGRLKEMIKTGGFSVDPVEVERALTAIPGIEAAAVIGVPDARWGEMVVGYVVSSGEGDEAAVIGACRAHLAGFKVPKRVLFLDALPVNATGKIERGRLRERFAAEGPTA